jgi:hypothetical protein
MVLPAALYGLAAGVILVLVKAPEWAYSVATLPYWPFFLHQMNGRFREESPPGNPARGRRSGRRLG